MTNSIGPRALVSTVLLIAGALAAGNAQAETQSLRAHSLALGALIGARSVRDDILVPLAATGPALTLSGRFLGTAGSGIVDAELRLGGGIGVWNGERLVSEEWIQMMTRVQATSTTQAPDGHPFDVGYYWWLVPNGASAWGHGGQFVLVQPARRMVLVHIALPDTADMDGSALGDFLNLVAPLLE